MAQKRRMFQNDLKPDYSTLLEDVELDEEGEEVSRTPVDLSTAIAVRVIGVLTEPRTAPVAKFDREASTTDNAGRVTMLWEDGDTDTVGLISTEVEVMWTGNKPQTFRPPELVQIVADLGGTA